MSLQGPLIVIAERHDPAISAALAAAGAFPVVETAPADAIAAIDAAKPEAILLGDDIASCDTALAEALVRTVTAAAPVIPVIARVNDAAVPAYREALPVSVAATPHAAAVKISLALRVRNLHRSVLRRADVDADGRALPVAPKNDPLSDATVIVAGRGRAHPVLSVAVGERAGLIGALTIETAARYLKQRKVDGLVIGDGFSATAVNSLLTVLSEDPRFRDLPIGVLARPGIKLDYDLNVVVASEAAILPAFFLPYVRLHAFEARLRRVMMSLEHDGIVDPDTGLLRSEAFLRELDRALRSSIERGVGLSLARFAFPDAFGEHAGLDAARLISHLTRTCDFACRQDDGSVLVAFGDTDLRHAHVVARRLASALKYTMLNADLQRGPQAPSVTLASRKSSDTLASLLSRVTAPAIAAE